MVSVPGKIAVLIAGFMEDRLDEAQAEELTQWLHAADEHMQMFELLTEERNAVWAKKWFAKAGVKNHYFRGKRYEGWYREEPGNLKGFYVLIVCAVIAMALIFLMIKYLPV